MQSSRTLDVTTLNDASMQGRNLAGSRTASRSPAPIVTPRGACDRERDGQRAPCGHRQWPCGRGNRDGASARACLADKFSSRNVSGLQLRQGGCRVAKRCHPAHLHDIAKGTALADRQAPDLGRLMTDGASQVNRAAALPAARNHAPDRTERTARCGAAHAAYRPPHMVGEDGIRVGMQLARAFAVGYAIDMFEQIGNRHG